MCADRINPTKLIESAIPFSSAKYMNMNPTQHPRKRLTANPFQTFILSPRYPNIKLNGTLMQFSMRKRRLSKSFAFFSGSGYPDFS
jgi:hypothetical protein